MGFFDVVAGIGKAAGKAMGDAMTKQHLDAWDKVKSASDTRLRDFYDQNNSAEKNNRSNRALALAAMGGYQARDLLTNDEDARRALTSMREKIVLDDSSSADSLREAIDSLLR